MCVSEEDRILICVAIFKTVLNYFCCVFIPFIYMFIYERHKPDTGGPNATANILPSEVVRGVTEWHLGVRECWRGRTGRDVGIVVGNQNKKIKRLNDFIIF